jgi:hypothetical protein
MSTAGGGGAAIALLSASVYVFGFCVLAPQDPAATGCLRFQGKGKPTEPCQQKEMSCRWLCPERVAGNGSH